MTKYQELQKKLFDWLNSKYEKNNEFTFSVRQKANKGAELNYFIGTERSKYFSTTFWFIPVAYPGSSGDLINLVVDLRFKEGFEFFIQFNQTKTPSGKQNEYALELIRNIKKKIEGKFGNTHYAPESNKMEFFAIYSPKKYNDFEEITSDLDDLLDKIIPIVNEEIVLLEKQHPDFIAHRFTAEEQNKMFEKMQERFERYKIIEELEDELEEEEDFVAMNAQSGFNEPLNQILYGPPGTGKTYQVIEKAVQIANPNFDISQPRDLIKAEYERLQKNGQIVFTTFHQSMSYEDFIEGIKPLKPETDDTFVKYDIIDGMLKNLSKKAIKEYYIRENNKKEVDRKLLFDTAWTNFILEANRSIDENGHFYLKSFSKKDLEIVSFSNFGNIIIRPKVENALDYTVSYNRTQKLFDSFDDLTTIQNIDKEFREVIGGSNSTAYWAVVNYLNEWIKANKNLTKKDETINEDMIKFSDKIVKNNLSEDINKYILIIDEINRGNVSQIFGELITLIEEDKRLGKEEALEILLPYSKEKFGVPSNLHIIGTMNTADRSVEALDTALRRRFSFVEMMPEYDELFKIQFDDFNLGELLITINARIEALLDRDHTIGHSYFINIQSNDTEALKHAFQNKIIPLLQEYFYHDYEKIALILGEGFVECLEPNENKIKFANWSGRTLEKPDITRVFNITKIDNEFNINSAIKSLLNRE